MIMEVWDKGISTRKDDALVVSMGSQVSTSYTEVNRICRGLDSQLQTS